MYCGLRHLEDVQLRLADAIKMLPLLKYSYKVVVIIITSTRFVIDRWNPYHQLHSDEYYWICNMCCLQSCLFYSSAFPYVSDSGLAVYAYRASPTTSAMYPVIYGQMGVDYNNNFHTDNNVMTPPTNGIYWFALSAGVAQYIRTFYELSSASAPYMVAISRQHSRNNGFDTLSKDAIVQLGAGATVRVNSQYALYSDVTRQTSLAAFSITDIMGPQAVYFMAGFTSGDAGPGRVPWKFPVPLDSRGSFSQINNEYTCPVSGIYVFSFGLFVAASTPLHAVLRIVQPQGTTSYELRRTHQYNAGGGDTLSRSVISPCNAGSRVYVEIISGRVVGSNDYSSSFMGFLYQPINTSPTLFSVSFDSYFENSQTDRATITVPFNRKNFQEPGNFNVPNSQIRELVCPVTGIYYLSLTAVAAPSRLVNLYMDKSGENVGGIYRSSAWQGAFYDTLSRSAIVRCDLGQRFSVRMPVDSAVAGSSAADVTGTNFWGMLLYTLWAEIKQIP